MEIEGTIRAIEPYFERPECKMLLRVTLDPSVAGFADALIGRRVRLVVEEEPVGSVTATCGYVPPSMTVSFEGNTWVAEGPVPSPTEFIALSGGPLDRKTFYCPEGDALQIGPDIYRSIGRRLPSGERIFVHVGPSPVEALFHALASVPEAIEPPVNGPAAATEGSWLTRKSLF